MISIDLSQEIEMIAIDLDGTLLNSQAQVTDVTKKVLHKCIDAGYKVVIATGRNYATAKALTNDIPDLTYITSNGSNIVDTNGELLLNKPILNNKAIDLIEILEQEDDLSYSIYLPDHILVTNKFNYLKKLFLSIEGSDKSLLSLNKLVNSTKKLVSFIKHVNKMPIKEIDNPIEFMREKELDIQKIFAMGDKTRLDIVKSKMNSNFKDINLSSSGKNNLEINAVGATKGAALEFLSSKSDISVDKSLVFGDGGNDLEIFDSAGVSVVMDNSDCAKLKKKADFVAPSNDENGVAEVLMKLKGKR
ncbi:Cof-type HAD-IIB family hydrolase [Halanaerocella petrolearia]